MEKQGTNMRYELAAAILPSRLRRIAMELPEQDRVRAEEFHLRAAVQADDTGITGTIYALRFRKGWNERKRRA